MYADVGRAEQLGARVERVHAAARRAVVPRRLRPTRVFPFLRLVPRSRFTTPIWKRARVFLGSHADGARVKLELSRSSRVSTRKVSGNTL